MNAAELRTKYLEFFKSKGHVVIPSASLIPENDSTTLFTGSGMQPMIPYLLGEKHPLGIRLADSQKSFRTADIEEVGDNRHTTFFEMLGNWSLGDYFKKEQITWMFEFLTQEIGLDPKRIYVTVFRGKEDIGIPRDSEAVEIWKEQFTCIGIESKDIDFSERDGMQGGRIFYYDETKNWWSRSGVPDAMPIGEPGGPDSEMFWDFGEHLKIHENSFWKNKPCHVNCDCGRFMEIGNNVFMEYIKTEKGFEFLEQKNVDYGGGLERQIAAALDTPDIFKTDLFSNAISAVEKLSGKKYEENKEAFRVIVDHLRAATFLISDGALPGNKDQGYFTRRLIRRAVRYAHKLGVKENYCGLIADVYIEYFREAYPDLNNKKEKIIEELKKEEDKFRKTLENGLKEFEKYISNPEGNFIARRVGDEIQQANLYPNDDTASMMFNLYQTYGFPIEMVFEELEKEGVDIDNDKKVKIEDKFSDLLKKHQDLSRTASAGMFKGGLADNKEETTQLHTAAHLMLAGLRKVLGEHVHQKGSNINGERLRFDFSHPQKMTDEEKKAVEDFVNEAINAKVLVKMKEMSLDEARVQGAEGAFENKYGDVVKVYEIEGFSNEICGGPHVNNTGDIKGIFRIVKEESSSAGVRRIKATIE